MNRDHHDAMIDQILREILGGDRPRDLTERVIAHAKLYDRVRRRWWIATGSALAACVAIAITLWALWPQTYPDPTLEEGDLAVLNGTHIERGSQLETPEGKHASVDLGGYVNVVLDPQSAMTLGGSRYAEKVTLDRGFMDVAVTKKKGTFDVAIGPAIVHVTGTKFKVGVQNKEFSDRNVKQLVVAVKEGSVVVSGVDKDPVTLAAGSADSERIFEISSAPKLIKPRFNPARAAATERAISAPPPASTRSTRNPETSTSTTRESTTRESKPLSTSNTTRPITTRPVAPAALSRALQVIIEPGKVELNGRLGVTVSDVYFLETADRRILLFAQQTVPPTMPRIGSYVHVTWENGKTLSVDPLATTTSPASQPH